jgi:inositol oxygenase
VYRTCLQVTNFPVDNDDSRVFSLVVSQTAPLIIMISSIISPDRQVGLSGNDMAMRGPSLDLDKMMHEEHLAENRAAQELLYRLNHARQTFDFVQKQAKKFSMLSLGEMDVWTALESLSSLREYEAALVGDEHADPDMPLVDHAFQCAAICREMFPEDDWMVLVGLLHGLGKLLAHPNFGSQPQWCICGESFPVGCRFSSSIANSNFFQANPDRRKKSYSTPLGIYQPRCGLKSVFMSWSGAEYLYMVLALNKTNLPSEALFMIRYHKFRALVKPGQAYHELLSERDLSLLPKLGMFMDAIQYKKREGLSYNKEELKDYCDAIIEKYIPNRTIRW